MIKEKEIFLSPPKRYSDDIPFPTFLCTDDNRLEIRFDTNGFLFSDYNFAEKFVGGIYNLFQEKKLNNLLIRIDYSFKGVHPLEVYWSQNQNLPVDKNRINDFKIEDNPQYPGLKNIFDLIKKYNQENPEFDKCLRITVEPGINNVKRNFMYYENSLNWSELERRLQEKLGQSFYLSDVDNKMEVRGKIHTHLKRGVAVKLVFDQKEFICLPTDPKPKKDELFDLIKKLEKENKSFVKIYMPYTVSSE